ncbi:MAG TPA: hypothetical protein VLJ21_00660 [Candidatus Binatia bacterium]|nr:hypothetical protein [Candidatus Binatia bacterium]
MEKRKIIRQGKGTLTMSLPSAWVHQLGLHAGDELAVEQKGLQLVIGASLGAKHGKRTELDVSMCKRGIINGVLSTLYTRGDDEFVLQYKTPEQYRTIVDGVKNLVGFEVVEHAGNKVVLKELAHTANENFDQILRRIFLLLVSMAEEGVIAFREKKDLTVLRMQDLQVNSLVLFSLRVLNKQGVNDVQKAMHLYALLNFLEQLGDEYARLYREVETVDAKTIQFAARIAKLVRGFYDMYYNYSLAKASALKQERDDIRNELKDHFPKAKKRDDLIALNHLRQIGDLAVDIMKFQLAMQI